jgi:DNA-binding FadR family transcriptional regulator
MSISPLSTNLLSDLSQQHRQNPFQEIKQDFSQLASALQSGNLTDAQSAYSNIQQLLGGNQNSSSSNTSSSGSNPIQNDFAALGQALQSGNLTQAQSAFSQLQTDVQSVRQANQNQTPPVAQDQFVSTAPPTLTPAEQVQQDYTQLASALQSGNLTSAQTAFTALQQALQTQTGSTTAPSTTPTSSSDPIANDFNALGQALSSGNLSQAQSAFAQLQSDVQTAQQSTASQAQSLAQALKTAVDGHHHHHGHHGGGGESSSQSSSSTTSSTSSSSTTGVNVYA